MAAAGRHLSRRAQPWCRNSWWRCLSTPPIDAATKTSHRRTDPNETQKFKGEQCQVMKRNLHVRALFFMNKNIYTNHPSFFLDSLADRNSNIRVNGATPNSQHERKVSAWFGRVALFTASAALWLSSSSSIAPLSERARIESNGPFAAVSCYIGMSVPLLMLIKQRTDASVPRDTRSDFLRRAMENWEGGKNKVSKKIKDSYRRRRRRAFTSLTMRQSALNVARTHSHFSF